jgi:phosphoglycerol transferase MdoB-like AlkP superfamily enzyme
VLVPISTSSGESLEHRVGDSRLVQEYAHLGDLLVWWVVPLAVLAAVLYWWHRGGRDERSGPPLTWALAVLPVVVALGTLVQVVLIGHSGARAAWSNVGSASASQSGSADGG